MSICNTVIGILSFLLRFALMQTSNGYTADPTYPPAGKLTHNLRYPTNGNEAPPFDDTHCTRGLLRENSEEPKDEQTCSDFASSNFKNMDQDTKNEGLKTCVKSLVTELITTYERREMKIGSEVKDFRQLIRNGRLLFRTAADFWEDYRPSVNIFLRNISDIADRQKIASYQLVQNIRLIYEVGNMIKKFQPKKIHRAPNATTKARIVKAQGAEDRLSHKLSPKLSPRCASKSTRSGAKWWIPVSNLTSYLSTAITWYKFLEGLHISLGLPEAHLQRIRLSKGFLGFAMSGIADGLKFRKSMKTLQEQLLNNSNWLEEIDLQDLWNSSNKFRWQQFTGILQSALSYPKCNVTGNFVSISGSYVLISQIKSCVNDAASSFRSIVVAAATGIIFDEDFTAAEYGRSLDMVILSPSWIVFNRTRKIDLSAASVNSPNLYIFGQNYFRDSKSTKQSSSNNGGSFFGSADTVTGENLIIVSNGRSGGSSGHVVLFSTNGSVFPNVQVVQDSPPSGGFDYSLVTPAVLHYKTSMRNHSTLFTKQRLLNFSRAIDLNSSILTGFSVYDFEQEFLDLQNQTKLILLRDEVQLHYVELINKAAVKMENYPNNSEEARTLDFLRAAAIAKQVSSCCIFRSVVLTNVLVFLETEYANMTSLQNETSEVRQYEYVEHFARDSSVRSDLMIQGALHFIETDLLPTAREFGDKIKNLTLSALNNITKQSGPVNSSRNGQRMAHKKLETHKIVMAMYDVLGTYGYTLHGLLYAATLALDGFKSADTTRKNSKPSTKAKNRPVNDVISQYQLVANNTLTGFLKQLDSVDRKLSQHAEIFSEILVHTKKVRAVVQQHFCTQTSSSNTTYEAFTASFSCFLASGRVFHGSRIRIGSSIKALTKAYQMNNTQSVAEPVLQVSRQTLGILGISVYLWHFIYDDHNGIDKLSEIVLQAPETAFRLERHIVERHMLLEDQVCDLIGILTQQQNLTSQKLQNSLNKFSWGGWSVIRDFHLSVSYAVEFLGSRNLAERPIAKLQSSFLTTNELLNRINEFNGLGAILSYVIKFNSNPAQYFQNLSNADLQKMSERMRYTVQSCTFLKRSQISTSMFRSKAFPLISPEICTFVATNSWSLDISSPMDVLRMLNRVNLKNMEMLNEVRRCRPHSCPDDEYTIVSEFIDDDPIAPFYIWDNSSNADLIADLLSGERVQFYANFMHGPKFCDAIRISRMSLNFVSAMGTESVSKEVAETLKLYRVELSNSEEMSFTLGDTVHTLPTLSYHFNFTFSKKEDGNPLIKNVAYDELMEGNITLSPFVFWNIKIVPVPFSVGYNKLQRFKGQVNLNLEGDGVCTSKDFASEVDVEYPDCSKMSYFG